METCPTNLGLMPDGEMGCDSLDMVFNEHLFKDVGSKAEAWKMTAAISGAHTVGRAHITNSGFNGHWSDADN